MCNVNTEKHVASLHTKVDLNHIGSDQANLSVKALLFKVRWRKISVCQSSLQLWWMRQFPFHTFLLNQQQAQCTLHSTPSMYALSLMTKERIKAGIQTLTTTFFLGSTTPGL